MIEELLEVLYRQVCTAAVLFYTDQVCVHRHETMYEFLHENHLTVAAEFEHSDSQGERVVPQAVDFGDHEFGWRQAPEHGVRRV